MAEELGFRTPAKELETLRKRVEQIEGVATDLRDALKLSMGALVAIFTYAPKPRGAREMKDALVELMKILQISPGIINDLDEIFRRACDHFDQRLKGS